MLSPAERVLQAVLAADQTPAYNTAAAARRSGVMPATFRAWERRYGFPLPPRSAGNQRSYSERDVRALAWLRDRLAEGMTISAAIALLRERLNRAPSGEVGAARPPARLGSELEQALAAFDRRRADLVLAEAFALYPIERVCLEVIQPTLVSIGDGWHSGRLDTAQEHFASTFARRLLAELLDGATSGPPMRRVVVACAPGDRHELGLLMVAVFLARAGWRVFYLGSSLPLDGLEAGLRHLRPAALALSATTRETADGVGAMARLVADLPPPRPIVGFGGQPFDREPGLRDSIAGVYLGPTAASAVERLEEEHRQRGVSAAVRCSLSVDGEESKPCE